MTENNEKQVLDRQVADWTRERDRLNGLIALATGQARQQKSEKPAEREAFEAWVREELSFDGESGDPCKRGQCGYLESNVDSAWCAWQARAALAQQPQGEAVDIEHMKQTYYRDGFNAARAIYAAPPQAAPVAQGLTLPDLEALRDAVDDLDCELSTRYQGYPQDDRRRARDFAVVSRARAILAQAAPRADHAGEGAEMVATGKQSLKVDPSASAGQAEPDAFEEARKAYVALTNAVAFEGDRARYIASQTIMDCFDRLFGAPAPTQDTQEPRRCKVGSKCDQCTCRIRDAEENVAAPAPSASLARIETLRKALFESRDAMRVMANWVKKSDPAGHSWGVRMVDRANAALSGDESASPAALTGDDHE